MRSQSLLTAAIAALSNIELVSAHTFIWVIDFFLFCFDMADF